MKLLICGINHAPELTGIGKYTGEMAAWLARAGVEVRVVTAPPYYPQWKVGDGYSAWRYRREQLGGVDVLRCPLYVPRRVTGTKRLVHLASFGVGCVPGLLGSVAWRPDIVFVVEPTFFCVPQALALARLTGAKAWLHVQDLEVDACLQLGMLSRGVLTDAALAMERWFMNCFDRVSTISAGMAERLRQKDVDAKLITRLDNWVDTQLIHPLSGDSSLRRELDLPDEGRIVLYSGNMGEKQGLDIIIEAARLLHEEPLTFVLCGAGAARQRLQDGAQDLANVRFLPLQPFARLNELLNMADVHLLPQRSDVEELVMPSKLTGILSAGGAVVATARRGSELARAVDAAQGVVVEPGNTVDFAAAVGRIAADDALRRQIGIAARSYAEQHMSREAILSRLLAELRSLAGQAGQN